MKTDSSPTVKTVARKWIGKKMKHNITTLSIMCFSLCLLATLFTLIGKTNYSIEIEHTDFPEIEWQTEISIAPTPFPTIIDVRPLEKKETFSVTYERMELTSLGTYYITSYCPSECGYNGYNYPTGWMTASDTICHRADYNYRLSEPTTCAISRSIHSFGDTFYIPEFDRTFVAEDTGSAVKGRHLDLFYEEYSDVYNFPTGYYEVYEVTWVEETITVTEEELEMLEEYGIIEFLLERENNESD